MFNLQKEDQDQLAQDLEPQISDPVKHKIRLNSIILVMTKLGNDEIYLITFGCHLGKADLKSGNDVTPGHVSSFGVPKILHTRTMCQNISIHYAALFIYLLHACLEAKECIACII